MKVTVKQYLEDTHELSCIIEDKVSELSGSVIVVDPFATNAIEINLEDMCEVMVNKTYEMSEYFIDSNDVYCPNVFSEIESPKTQPCPICGTHLIAPKDFFPALHKLNEKLESHGELAIKDHEIQKELDKKDYIGKKCAQCGKECDKDSLTMHGDVCRQCMEENRISIKRIKKFLTEGHTDHCAKRIVWGDGECECGEKIHE